MMKTNYEQDPSNKKLLVTREFAAGVDDVWAAWTEAEILDQWWAPKPWKAKTKSMNFAEGGTWLYSMVGPEGEEHFSKVDYKTINPTNQFTAIDCFCDDVGKTNTEMPVMQWICDFTASGNGTTVRVDIAFDNEEDMKKIVEMGFKDGFAMAHDNLDEVLAKGK